MCFLLKYFIKFSIDSLNSHYFGYGFQRHKVRTLSVSITKMIRKGHIMLLKTT